MKNICILFLIVFFCGCGNNEVRNEEILRYNLYENGNANLPKESDDINIGSALIVGGGVALGVLGIAYNIPRHGYRGHYNSGWKHNKPKYKPVHRYR